MRARLCKMQESFAQRVFTTKLGTLCKIGRNRIEAASRTDPVCRDPAEGAELRKFHF